MSVISGVLGYMGATEAADTQAAAAEQAAALQYQIYLQQAAMMQPWAQSGLTNLTRMNYALYGQMPTAQSMMLSPDSIAYQQYVASHPGLTKTAVQPSAAPGTAPTGAAPGSSPTIYLPGGGTPTGTPPYVVPASSSAAGLTLYMNPLTGEITTAAPELTAEMMGVAGGSLNPSDRFTTADWQASPEYAAYAGARDAAIKQSQDALAAQAGAGGLYGSGNVANALATNVGQLYAQYDPASLAAAQQNWNAARTQEFNMLAGLANPSGAQQIANYSGNYGTSAGNLMLNAGAAQAQGITNATQQLQSGISTGVNVLSDYYRYSNSQPNTGYNPAGTTAAINYLNSPAGQAAETLYV